MSDAIIKVYASQEYVTNEIEPINSSINEINISVNNLNTLVGDMPVSEHIKSSSIPIPDIATVGQTLAVKTIDENGKPIEWECVDLPTIDDILAALPTWTGGSY